jgi:DUF971 family protein
MTPSVVPTALDLRPDRLQVQWVDGVADLRAADLRAACRCAGCRAADLQGQRPALPSRLSLTGAQPVGRYAVQLIFSDGHDRGIYPWAWLRELGSRGVRSRGDELTSG